MAAPLVHEAFEPFDKADLNVDIAVVGAGVAGVYTAWRLKQKFPKSRIALFEYSNRIGGRLYSVSYPAPHVNAELGGMRFIPIRRRSCAADQEDVAARARIPDGRTRRSGQGEGRHALLPADYSLGY